jgi:nucleotide-binding universal stress UspA family protein
MPFSALQQGSDRKIAIAVDLSDESAYAVKWAVANYLRPGDSVVILHVRPTSVLFGADWGASDQILEADKESQQKMEDDFDIFTSTKSADLAKPLSDAKIPYKIHIVKDHDMKERICLEVERLGVNAVIMGSRGKDRTTFFQCSRFPGLCVIARNPFYLQITSTCASW